MAFKFQLLVARCAAASLAGVGSKAYGNARNRSRGRPRYQLGEAAQVLCNGCEGELILCTAWAAQPKPTKSQDAFEVGEQHLDAFAIATRSLEGLGFADGTSNVAGLLINAARDLPRRLHRAASHLERAHITIELARPIEQLLVIHDLPRGGERLAGGTGVDVTRLVEREVSREKMPSSRLDLSMTGMCGVIFFSLTIQLSIAADP